MTTTLFRGALACALLTSTALTAPALGQANQSVQPAFRGADENGVDLISGSYPFTLVEGTIGSGDTGLSVVRTGTNTYGTATWQNIYVSQSVSGSVRTAIVVLGDRSETFTSTGGGAFVAAQGNGATLTGGLSGDFTYTDAGGTAYGFGAPASDQFGASNLCSHVQSNPNGCFALATGITRPDGATVALDWDMRSHCATVFNPDGGLDCSYAWRLAGVDNSFGYGLDFSYVSDSVTLNQLPSGDWFKRSGATLSNGSATSAISYDYVSASVTRITDTGGRIWQLTTGANSLGIRWPGSSSDDVSVTFSGGVVTQVVRDGITTSYSRSVSGGNATTTVTDAASNVTTVVADLGLGRIISVTDPLSHTTTYAYDGNGRLTRATGPEGNSIGYTYDARGNVTETRLREKDDTSDTGDDIVVTASYDSVCSNVVTCNQPNSVTDALAHVTDYSYDSTHGGLLSVTAPAPSGSATRPQTRYSYTQTNGEYRPTGVSACASGSTASSPNCVGTADETRTVIAYDASGNATSVELRNGLSSGSGALSATRAMTYDGYGNLLSVDGPLDGAADTIRYRYNDARQVIGVIGPDPDGGGALRHRALRTTYGSDGQPMRIEQGNVDSPSDGDWAGFVSLEEVQAEYDSHHRPVVQRLVSGSTTYALTQTSYDSLGRVQCVAQRMNSSEFVPSSLPTDVCTVDTEGGQGRDRISRTSYDAAGRVNLVETGVDTGDAASEVAATYSNNGQIATMTDAEGNRTTYEYDGFDRLRNTRFPSPTTDGVSAPTSGTGADYEQYGYDAAGNLTSRRVRSGATINFEYDNLNRLTLKDVPGNSAAEFDVTYAYDNFGRMLSATAGTGLVTGYGYDALGRVTSESGPFGTNAMRYDLAGRMTRLTWPDAFYVDYGYDAAGAVTAIRENGATTGAGVLATFAYDDRGRRTSLTRGNGLVTSYSFDGVSRLSGLAHDLNGTSSDLTLGFGHNPAGQIASNSRSNDAFSFTGHANINRADTVNGLNQVTATGATSVGYDARGNIQTVGSNYYEYTAENRLAWAWDPDATGFAYDPLGRLHQSAYPTTTRYAHAGAQLVTELDNANAVQRRYVFGPGIDEPLVWYEGSGTSDRRWLHADERGSIIAASDGNGDLVGTRNRYDEYGVPQGSLTGRFGYTGQAWLPEIGMSYYRNRIYNPGLGRFMQTDPIGYGGGMNIYAYVSNDPVNFIDPDGLDEMCVTFLVITKRIPNPDDEGGTNVFDWRTVCWNGGSAYEGPLDWTGRNRGCYVLRGCTKGLPPGPPNDPNPDRRRDRCGNPLPPASRRYSVPPGYQANPADPNHQTVYDPQGRSVLNPYFQTVWRQASVGRNSIVNWAGVRSDLGEIAVDVGIGQLTGAGLRSLFGAEFGAQINAANRVDRSAEDAIRSVGGQCSR